MAHLFDVGRVPVLGQGSDLAKQLHDYRLTTAEILYSFPDFPNLLQTFIWQDYDLSPRFPVLRKFLGFWEKNIEGRVATVRVSALTEITPGKMRHAQHEFSINQLRLN